MRQRTYALSEIIELGYEAHQVAEDGAYWLFHGCWALRVDAVRETRTLVTDVALMPESPWRLTAWGAAELERGVIEEDEEPRE